MAWLASLLVLGVIGCGDDGDGVGTPRADAGAEAMVLSDGSIVLDSSVDSGGRIDGGTSVPRCSGMCNPTTGGGCGTDRTCMLTGIAPSCADKAGMGAASASCMAELDCEVGLSCFRTRRGGECARVCCPGSEGVCSAAETCSGPATLVDGVVSGWGRCVASRPCDVLRADGACDPGEGCYIVSPVGETDCRAEGDRGAGETCERQNDCERGFFCLPAAGICVRVCGLSNGQVAACPDGEGVCRAYSHSPEGTGLCTLLPGG